MRIALMAVLFAVSTPAFAATDPKTATTVDGNAAQPATQSAKTSDAAEKKICKRIEASESRLGAKKVCLTEEQWKQRAAENSDF
jgi:hypothetical protein